MLLGLVPPDIPHPFLDTGMQLRHFQFLLPLIFALVLQAGLVGGSIRAGVNTNFTTTILPGDALADFHLGITEIAGGDAAENTGRHSAQFWKISYAVAERTAAVNYRNGPGLDRCQREIPPNMIF